VIGGGPAGLYFALLAKTRIPSADVSVYEQNPPGATYGFGIVLADHGLDRFRKAHPASYEAIVNASFVSRNRIITHPADTVFIEGGGYGGAIARLRLLEILEEFCAEAGVVIRYDARIEKPEQFTDADLVVGADGVNSVVRRWKAFGTTNFNLTNRLAWYGTKQHFAYPILAFVKTSMGHFVGAAYAYTERMSTFVAECDAETWARSGLDEMSDDEAREFAGDVFARELNGHTLISNNSVWRQLPVVRNREWSVGNCVLIGDALHSAHPTIGSGTRIAMEDSIALADALEHRQGDILGSLAAFRRVREPQKNKLVTASEKSFLWYEKFAEKMDSLEPVPFVFDFLMRTGRLTNQRLNAEYPHFMARYAGKFQRPEGAEHEAERAKVQLDDCGTTGKT
jgi:2-polyprenyl-6-methoxyphenol hydroxylase-like FAD-dependent oxidoreductase